MTTKTNGSLAGLLLAGLLAGAAAAEPAKPTTAAISKDTVLQRLTGETLLAVLEENGWTATLSATSDGTPYLVSSMTDPESGAVYNFEVGLYRCEGTEGCYDIVFTYAAESTKPVTLKMVNDYNRKQLFGCAYLTAEGKLGLSLSQSIQGGFTRQTVSEISTLWAAVLLAFDGNIVPS